MTYEPPEQPPQPAAGSQPYVPPTPPAPPVPPPPAQQWPAPPSASAQGNAFNPATVSPYDWGILAAGFLAFIFSLFSYYTASYAGISASESAWHGFFGWFAALVALLSAGLLAVHIFLPSTKLPVPLRLTVFGGFALASLCVILAGLIDGDSVPSPVSSGRGAGYYLSLIVILGGAVVSFLRLRETGGKMPWESKA